MDLLLRVGAALIGLLVIIVSLRSVLQVAVVNGRRGDWLARRIGWLVYTTLARRALGRQSYADIQDVLGWVLPLYILLLIVVWFSLVLAGFSLLIWSCQAEHSVLQSCDRQRLGAQHTRLPYAARHSGSAACNPGRRNGAWCRCILFYLHPRISDDDPIAAGQSRLALRSHRP